MSIAADISFGVELEALFPLAISEKAALKRLGSALTTSGLPASIDYTPNAACHLKKGRPSSSRWVIKYEFLAPTEDDKIRHNAQDFLCFEISSPVLMGDQGLSSLQTMLNTVALFGAFANESCGYHVHASPRGRRYTEQEIGNFIAAAAPQENEYSALIDDKRIDNYNCRDYLSSTKHNCKINLQRVAILGTLGRILPFKSNPFRNPFMKTIEWRGKEAEGFENGGIEHLDYTTTVVNFTSAAIANVSATFRDAARLTCQGHNRSKAPTRSWKLASQSDRYVA